MQIGIAGVLTLIFMVLKLVGTITWSWWLVLLPCLIAWGLSLVIFAILGIAYYLQEMKGK